MRTITTFFLLLTTTIFGHAQLRNNPPLSTGKIIEEGLKLHDEEKYDEAIAKYDMVSRNDTNYTWALYEKTLSLYSKKDYTNAIKTASYGISMQSAYIPDFYIILGSSLDDSGKKEEAIEVYKKALTKYPYQYRIYYNLGLVYSDLWKINEAADCFQKAIEYNYFHANSHRALGLLCLVQDQPSRATLSLLTYLTIRPQDGNAPNDIIKLEKYLTQEVSFDPDSVLLKPNEDFQTTDLILKSEASLNDRFKLLSKLDFKVVRQMQALLEKLEYDANSNDFWMRKYVPYYKKLWEKGYFNTFTYYWLASVDERAKKKYEKEDSDIKTLIKFASDEFKQINFTKKLTLNGKEGHYRVGTYDNNIIQSIVEKYDEEHEKLMGYTEFYHSDGAIASYGIYDENGLRKGEWKFFYENGKPSQIAMYNPKDSTAHYKSYYQNGVLSEEGTNKNSVENGSFVAYYPGGVKRYEVVYLNGERNSKSIEYYKDGLPTSEATYVNGKLQGKLKHFHPNGMVLSEMEYSDGIENGIYKNYHLNGQLSVTGQIEKEKSTGEWIYYHENGKVSSKSTFKDNLRDGLYISFYNDGTKYSEGNYLKNEPVGTHKYYDKDGKLFLEEDYENNLLKSYKYYDKQGKVLHESSRKGDILELKAFYPSGAKKGEEKQNKKGRMGLVVEYYESGGKKAEAEYKDGKLNGYAKEYTEVGKLSSEANYKNDTLNGYIASYYPNGKINQEGWYVMGNSQGDWLFYHPNGLIKDKLYFIDNKSVGYSEHFGVNGKKELEYYVENDLTQKVIQYDTTGQVSNIFDMPTGNGTLVLKGLSGKKYREVTYKNGVKTGEDIFYYLDGSKQMIVNYKHEKEWGTRVLYNTSGNKSYESQFVNNLENGTSKSYYNNGILEMETSMKEGKYDSITKWYDYNGTLEIIINHKNGMRNGEYVLFGEDGKTAALKFIYRDDQITGYTYLDKNNQWLPLVVVKNGTFDVKAYYPNGKPSFEGSFMKNSRHGLIRSYYMNGNIKNEKNFDLGIYEGQQKENFINGKPRLIYGEKDGQTHGVYKTFNENGTLIKEENYVCGNLHGIVKEYDSSGKLIRSRNFYNDTEY